MGQHSVVGNGEQQRRNGNASEPGTAAPEERGVGWRIAATSLLTFAAYLAIGLPMAVLPGYVAHDLGFGSMVSGVAASMQYAATLLSRPQAGRRADVAGPKRTVVAGLFACAASGLLLSIAAWIGGAAAPAWALAVLLLGRLALGVGESWVATGVIVWGIGRVGNAHASRILSMNGIASYGALALGAPVGVLLADRGGFAAVGLAALAACLAAVLLAASLAPTAPVRGEQVAFRLVFRKVLPLGVCQALGAVGFGVVSTFITLFYGSRGWHGGAWALTAFGTAFICTRLVCADAIRRRGGFPVAIASFAVECAGMCLLWQAGSPAVALAGAALAGAGFALVFPALALEAIALVAPSSRGTALGAYSLFLDVSLWLAGPVAGAVASRFSYADVYLLGALCAGTAALLSAALYRRRR